MELFTLIPAKGKSSRIKNKNLIKINGKNLLDYTLKGIFDSKELNFKDIFLSSEDPKILKYASQKKINLIKRPKILSKKFSSMESVLLQAIKFISLRKKYDYALILQPTSPLRDGFLIDKFIKHAKKNKFKFDCLLSVRETKNEFYLLNNNKVERLFKNNPRNTIQRKALFEENSCFYLIKISSFLRTKKIISGNIKLFVMNYIDSIDINEQEDINDFKRINI